MDDCKKFDEISLPGKEDFYCHLNMEDVTSTYYLYAKRICKDFEVKNLGECHDLYVFGNIRNRGLEIYELDPAKFHSVPGLEWLAALKTDVDMLLMVEKGIRGGICHSIYQYIFIEILERLL